MPWYCIKCDKSVKPFTSSNITYLEHKEYEEDDLELKNPTKKVLCSRLREQNVNGPYCPECFQKKELIEKEDNLVQLVWRD